MVYSMFAKLSAPTTQHSMSKVSGLDLQLKIVSLLINLEIFI